MFSVMFLLALLWFFRVSLLNSVSFGVNRVNEQLVIQEGLKLYQGNQEVGHLLKGTTLELTQQVDKMNHYQLNLIFEPSMYPKRYDDMSKIFKVSTQKNSTKTTILLIDK